MRNNFITHFLLASISACGVLFANSQAPNQPTNPSPLNQGYSSSLNPNLCAAVSDPNGGTLRVRYFGRKKPAANSKFTVIVIPDTQYYTEEPQGNNGGLIAMLNSQTNWVAGNRATKNIVYMATLGDCVQNGDNPPGANNTIEWERAANAMATIESPALTGLPQGIPFGITVGNHDQTPGGTATGTTTYYNQYFGISHFTGRSYYGGHYGSNNDNYYDLFSASGIDFLVISVEYDQTSAFSDPGGPLDWAEGLVQTYNKRKVIMVTHWGINENTTFSAQGLAIFNRLKSYHNFMLFLCGHVHTSDGEARRTDVFNGYTSHTLLSDYQDRPGGGNGLLRICEFDPILNKVSVKTYSPYTNTFETDADSQFDLTVNTFTRVGELTNISSGTTPCTNWQGLEMNTEYEWYVELFDGVNTTTGPVWTFTTPLNTPLPVELIHFAARIENKKVRLSWSTVQESGNDRFEIERSGQNSYFSKIGEVASKGNSNSVQNYYFYDEHPVKGESFYRLKQIDLDGRFTYSDILPVKFNANIFEIYPNPVTGAEINIHFENPLRGGLNISIYDMTGRRLYTEAVKNVQGIIRIRPRIPAGIYTLQMVSEEFNSTQKITVVR